eukprot:TRINITY_DN11339_c0_g2_i3.p2 TRINITY_DN11339_c0_g2~~TRINITY_DN11339_c0_g2_i3.p2  ORF type:complete len:324 (+),score=63.84 TRINITY_DN11339_c0_g2_i3:383-1354(+)
MASNNNNNNRMGGQGQIQNGAITEQNVQNAINFLMHPQVRNSTEEVKRQFLVQKGLSGLEIEEAFRRLKNQAMSYPSSQPHQIAGMGSALGYRGTQIVIGVGVVAGLAYLLKQYVAPVVSTWVEQATGIQLSPKPVDTQLAGEMRRATEAIQGVAADLKTSLASISNTMHVQQEQLRTQMMAMREEIRVSMSASPSPYPYTTIGGLTRSSTPEQTQPRHPEQYSELVAMLNRGQTPENVRTIDDTPPDPTIQLPPSERAKPVKPWENKNRNKSQDSAFFANLEKSIGSARTLRSESAAQQAGDEDDVNTTSITNSNLHGLDHN